MQIVEADDGVRLAVHELGPVPGGDAAGTLKTILFAHATGFHAHVWQPVVEALAALASPSQRYRCVAVDQRGHGLSPVPLDRPPQWRQFGSDVNCVIDALHLREGELFGVGHSMGGASLSMAELARPGTFDAIWAFEPIIIIPEVFDGPQDAQGDRPNTIAEGARRRREVFPSRREAYENYLSKPPFNTCDPVAVRAYVEHGFEDLPDGTVRLRCRRDIEAAVFEASRDQDIADHLGELGCQMLIASGNEQEGPALLGPQLARSLPRGRFQAMDMTHFGPLEYPAAIAQSIADFFAEVSAGHRTL